MSFPNGIVPTTETCVQQGWPADCRVHPTPLYEFFVWLLIAWALWLLGSRLLKSKNSVGIIFCGYLVLTGIARFLIEIIRLNPRTFFGMSNAQAASLFSVLLGVALFFLFVRNRQAALTPSAK
jgi:phosphatidylglycerol:prolipoprotein diacylglycerol transferase